MSGRTKGSNSEANIIRGISPLLNKSNIRPNVNYDEIESKYISSGNSENIKTADESEYKYRVQLKDISQKLGLDFGESNGENKSNGGGGSNNSGSNSNNYSSFGDTLNEIGNYEKEEEIEEEVYPGETPMEPLIPAGSSGGGSGDNNNSDNVYNNDDIMVGARTKYEDNNNLLISSEFAAKTNDELRHEQARSMMADMGYSKENSESFSMKSEEIQDYKINLLEEIDDLRFALEQIDPRVVARIPNVNMDSTTREIEEVAKTMRIKHDRYRYSTIADELLLVGVQGIEEVFDGKNVIFGRWQPNLTGWHTSVKVKLRRMRHDTSSIVGGTIREMGLGPVPRILLELIPNAFLYSNRNKTAFGQKTIRENIGQSIGNNIAQLNNM